MSGDLSPSENSQRTHFQNLGSYEYPSMPTQDTLARFRQRIRERVFHKTDAAFVGADMLRLAQGAGQATELAELMPCGLLFQELKNTLDRWLNDESQAAVKVVIFPPGESSMMLENWAAQAGLPVISPPAARAAPFPALQSEHNDDPEQIVVVPHLEQWILREQSSLPEIRRWCAEVALGGSPCVIGCSSWAWAWLSKAVGADSLLPEPVMFRAFDGPRLQTWFSELSSQAVFDRHSYRLARNGKVLFPSDDEADVENGAAKDFFQQLASRSLGIPWVAWQLWRRSLRVYREDVSDKPDQLEAMQKLQAESDRPVIWVVDPQPTPLSKQYDRSALRLLHALLIHEAMTREHLARVLPSSHDLLTLPALIRDGFIQSLDGRYRCHAATYSSVRSGLFDAGFRLDRL